MRSVETEGGSIDDAIARALAALGVSREEVEIDILENASPGLLGFRRGRARVRATVRVPLGAWAATLARERGDRDGADDAPAKTDTPARGGGADPAATRGAGPVDGARVRREGGGAPFDAAAFVAATLRLMGLDAAVRARRDGDGTRVEIAGDGAGAPPALGDDVLRALAFVVGRAAERQGGDGTRFTVVLAGRGRDDVRALARRLAERARTRGKAMTVHASDDEERAAVLQALRAEPGVTVRSVGHGTQRKLVIIPGERRRGGGARER